MEEAKQAGLGHVLIAVPEADGNPGEADGNPGWLCICCGFPGLPFRSSSAVPSSVLFLVLWMHPALLSQSGLLGRMP